MVWLPERSRYGGPDRHDVRWQGCPARWETDVPFGRHICDVSLWRRRCWPPPSCWPRPRRRRSWSGEPSRPRNAPTWRTTGRRSACSDAKPAERIINADGSVSKSAAAPLPWTSQEVTTPYTNAPTRTHGKVFFTLGGVGLRLLGHRAAELEQERGLDRRATASTKARATSPPTGSSSPPTRTARRRSGVYVADEPVHQLGLGQQRRLQLRRRRGGRRPLGRDGAHGSCRRPWHLVQLQPLAELRLLRLSGGAAVHRRAAVDLQLAAADQRQLGQPGDDGHRLRHDRRLQRRRLDRRREPVLGELLRVLQPAGRDVRARTSTASRRASTTPPRRTDVTAVRAAPTTARTTAPA